MIKIKIGERTVGLTRFFSALDLSTALEFVGGKPAAAVVCIDTPPTPVFVEFVRELHGAGRQVIVRDHHDVAGEPRSPRDAEIRAAADVIRTILGADAMVSDRMKNPACSTLVDIGEFAGEEYILVCDADADGLTAAVKALGVMYSELDKDAALLDGPPNRRQDLSPLGELLNKAGAALPPVSSPAYERETTALYEGWVAAVSGDTAARAELDCKVEFFDAMVTKAKALATMAIEVAPGVWLIDLVGESGYHMATLSTEVESRPGCRVTVVCKGEGPIAKVFGLQYSCARHSADKETDLRQFLPSGFISSPETGMIGNAPFLIHTSGEVFRSVVLPALQKG